jgi:hypothetical protein
MDLDGRLAAISQSKEKVMIEIKHRFTNAVLYTANLAADVRAAVIEASNAKADLTGAYLTGADLRGAYLTGADLTGADLTGAYLRGAYLRGAYLRGAYLTGADLTGADLRGAYLTGADLTGADLTGAYLRGADLTGADLTCADLTGAYLTGAIGLLPNGVVPLQIGGSSHWIIVREAGKISIGCCHETVEWWESHYAAIGRKESYTPAQVEEYRKHIEYAKSWMETNGVLVAEVKP